MDAVSINFRSASKTDSEGNIHFVAISLEEYEYLARMSNLSYGYTVLQNNQVEMVYKEFHEMVSLTQVAEWQAKDK